MFVTTYENRPTTCTLDKLYVCADCGIAIGFKTAEHGDATWIWPPIEGSYSNTDYRTDSSSLCGDCDEVANY